MRIGDCVVHVEGGREFIIRLIELRDCDRFVEKRKQRKIMGDKKMVGDEALWRKSVVLGTEGGREEGREEGREVNKVN